MENVLKWTGIVFIVAGILFSLTQISDLSEQGKDVKYWKDSAAENYDNDLIEQRYLSLNEIYKSNLTLTIGSLVSGIVSGIFFLALSQIINLLQQLVMNSKEQQNIIESISSDNVQQSS